VYRHIKTSKTFLEWGWGRHEHTLLSIELAPLYERGNYYGITFGLSLFYFCLFHVEWTRFINPRSISSLYYD